MLVLDPRAGISSVFEVYILSVPELPINLEKGKLLARQYKNMKKEKKSPQVKL